MWCGVTGLSVKCMWCGCECCGVRRGVTVVCLSHVSEFGWCGWVMNGVEACMV